MIKAPPVEQQIVINVICVGKLCHADAGLHRLRHQGDFEVAGEGGTSWSFAGDSDFTGLNNFVEQDQRNLKRRKKLMRDSNHSVGRRLPLRVLGLYT